MQEVHRRLPNPGNFPGLGRYLIGGNGNPLQYSYLENSMDRGAWQAIIHGVAKSQKWLSTHTHHLKIHTHMVKISLKELGKEKPKIRGSDCFWWKDQKGDDMKSTNRINEGNALLLVWVMSWQINNFASFFITYTYTIDILKWKIPCS